MYILPKSMSSCRAASHACALSAYAQWTERRASRASSDSLSRAVRLQHALVPLPAITSRRREVMTMGCSGGSPPIVPETRRALSWNEKRERRAKSMPATTTKSTDDSRPKKDIG